MSTPILTVVGDCAQAIGDPNMQRVSLPQWLVIYNRSNRELCTRVNILRFSDEFDLIANQTKYVYPEKMIVMVSLRVTETPSDPTTFRVVEEMYEDEFRERTDRLYPSATLPDEYFSTSSWFHLVPVVSATIVKGGCLTYFGLPDRISEEQMNSGVVLQVPDFAQDHLIRRMIIYGQESRNRLSEAERGYALWLTSVETLQDKLDDRSLDRRATIAPRKNRLAGMR